MFYAVHRKFSLVFSESFRSPIFQTGADKNGFSLGKLNNFKEVFGERQLHWFLPIYTSDRDGVSFPTLTSKSQTNSNSYQTMGQTESFGDGIAYPTRTVDISSDGLLADRQRWMEEGDADGDYNSHFNKAMNYR